MDIYLPIAEVSVNLYLILGLGGVVGFLSGLFGIGGGFLMTPLLIFNGIPPAVAVGTEANQIVASSISGVLAHWRRGNVDIKMGIILLIGGLLGSILGVWIFATLRLLGYVDVVIQISYVFFLGLIGILMSIESVNIMIKRRTTGRSLKHRGHHLLHHLPLKMRFRKSNLYISAITPMIIGFIVGVLSAIMGVGGGFIMVPAMIYILGMPTAIVVGTSLFQIIFVTANVTILHAVTNQTVDFMLALLLIVGGVIGAQLGVRLSARLQGEYLRGLLALIVLLTCSKLVYDLMVTPDDLYSLKSTIVAAH